MKTRILSALLVICLAMTVCTGCLRKKEKDDVKEKAKQEAEEDLEEYEQDFSSLEFQSDQWNYDKENKVYWQVQIAYCTDPADETYESMGIYVPAAYMDGVKNDDGTYTCTINETKTIKGYTGKTAPIILPVDTQDYAAKKGPKGFQYKKMKRYLKAGYIYLSAGMRGLTEEKTSEEEQTEGMASSEYSKKAPWGVTDLKAAVRFYRYNQEVLPGDSDQIYCFGTDEGGGLAVILGASGDSDLYTPYLTEIGAAMHDKEGNEISDEIAGVMVKDPVSGMDYINEAYEWNVGQYVTGETRKKGTWTKKFSNDMANIYADYINALKLTDEEGNALSLQKSKDGCYTSGKYYDYLLSRINQAYSESLNSTVIPGKTYQSLEEFYGEAEEKPIGAYDDLNRTQLENRLFGTVQIDALHFDATMSFLLGEYSFDYSRLDNWEEAIADAYSADVEMNDELGNSQGVRLSMYNPMYYVSPYYEGYQTATVAKHWNIQTDIKKNESLLTTQVNLALALENAEFVNDVEYSVIYGVETSNTVKDFIEFVRMHSESDATKE